MNYPDTDTLFVNITTLVGNNGTEGLRGGDSPGYSYEPRIPCGYCDTSCIYSALESLFVVGVLANIVVIHMVIKDTNLHDPTFTAIAALAFADMLFLALNLTTSLESVILTITCTSPIIISLPFYILKSIFWFAANAHVALLALLRYGMLAFPLRAYVWLSVRRVVALSIGVWILGIILMGTFTTLISLGIVLPAKSQEFLIVLWITVYLIPLLVTSALHLIKLFTVKKSTNDSSTEMTRKSIKRMSKIIIVVITMAAVLPLPRLISSCLKIANKTAFPSPEFKTHFEAIADLLFLINHFINPFIYGFLSQRFRKSLRRMFNCRTTGLDQSADDAVDTPQTSKAHLYKVSNE